MKWAVCPPGFNFRPLDLLVTNVGPGTIGLNVHEATLQVVRVLLGLGPLGKFWCHLREVGKPVRHLLQHELYSQRSGTEVGREVYHLQCTISYVVDPVYADLLLEAKVLEYCAVCEARLHYGVLQLVRHGDNHLGTKWRREFVILLLQHTFLQLREIYGFPRHILDQVITIFATCLPSRSLRGMSSRQSTASSCLEIKGTSTCTKS